MIACQRFDVSDDLVQAFQRDGAVVVKGVLDPPWRDVIAAGMDLNREHPTKRTVDYARDDTTGQRFFHDAATVTTNPCYEDYITHSPIGHVAAQMMGLERALAFYVTVFLRSPGTKARTPWHQDQTSWSAEGRHALSVWTSLDPVPEGTALEIVKGSHLWDRPMKRPYFEQNHLGGTMEIDGLDGMPIPDFSGADRDKYDIASWPMEPGDVLVFHGMTVHGGSGDLPSGLGRRSISVQWLGEDARITDPPGGADPDWLPELAEHGLGIGDYPACAMCPVIEAEQQNA